jgi:hypothetical protein
MKSITIHERFFCICAPSHRRASAKRLTLIHNSKKDDARIRLFSYSNVRPVRTDQGVDCRRLFDTNTIAGPSNLYQKVRTPRATICNWRQSRDEGQPLGCPSIFYKIKKVTKIMTVRTIKIIKPNQPAIGGAVPITHFHQMGEAEIRAERVLIVKNWIEERRANVTQERSGIRREIVEWRKLDVALPDQMIAISALTE